MPETVLIFSLVLIVLVSVIAAAYFYMQYRRLLGKDHRLSQAFEISREGVYYMDLQKHKTTVSDSYFRLLGYEPGSADFDPNCWLDFIHPDDRDWVTRSYDQIEQQDDTYISIRYRLLSRQQQYIWVLDRSKVVEYDAQGRAMKSIGTITQIDQLVEIEEALSQKNNELKDALDQLKNSQAKLVEAEKMASLGLMTSGLTYELNNPLNYVKGNVHPLRQDFKELKEYIESLRLKENLVTSPEGPAEEGVPDFDLLFNEIEVLLNDIEAGAGRSSEIVEFLQIFSFDKNSEKPMLLNINEIADTAIRLIHSRLGSNITIHKQFGEVKPVLGWPGRLNQSLVSLLCNSIEAIGELPEGHIYVSTFQKDDFAVVRIEDDGSGIDDRVRERIFEPFFTTKDQANGLGLPIIQSITESHDGHVTFVESEGNTVFELAFPSTIAGEQTP